MPHRPRLCLITGGAGFIGCNLVRHLLSSDPNVHVVILDALTYAGSLANLEEMPETYGERYRFIRADIADQAAVEEIFRTLPIDTVIHLAAESHVDRSIDDPLCFVRTNVLGTANLLHSARNAWSRLPTKGPDSVRFHHVSTDEVFGSLGSTDLFNEATAYDPSSPYSASKAGSDHLVRAWGRTYGLPITISNCSNNYGPFQFPEKLVPLMITNALAGKSLPVYGNGSNIRDWLYVGDHVTGIDTVVRRGVPGQTYCIGGSNEWRNIDIVQQLCHALDSLRPDPAGPYARLITFVADRPGHDQRYAIDAGRIDRDLGWKPTETFETGLRRTVQWYLDNQPWLAAIRAGRYAGERLGQTAS